MSIQLNEHADGRLIAPKGYFEEQGDENPIIIIEDFVDAADLSVAYEYAQIADMRYEGGSNGNLKDRVHTSDKFESANPNLFKLFKEKYYVEIKNLLEEKYGLELTGSYCTELHKAASESKEDRLNHLVLSATCGCKSDTNPFITAWTEGTSQKEHTDNSNEYTAIIYLNDNYEGGELNFPDLDLTIKPLTGSVMLWPGYLTHSISEVTSGTRYTMPVFLKAVSVINN